MVCLNIKKIHVNKNVFVAFILVNFISFLFMIMIRNKYQNQTDILCNKYGVIMDENIFINILILCGSTVLIILALLLLRKTIMDPSKLKAKAPRFGFAGAMVAFGIAGYVIYSKRRKDESDLGTLDDSEVVQWCLNINKQGEFLYIINAVIFSIMFGFILHYVTEYKSIQCGSG